MNDMFRELRQALRRLGKSPGFSLSAILILALGVGANTAIFSLISAVLLRPLPYDDPDRLVLVWESAPFFGVKDSPVAPANYFDWKARSRSFEEIGALEDQAHRLSGDGSAEIVFGSSVSSGVLRALRLRPQLGRIFSDDEDRPGAPKVALLSDGLWRSRFAGDPIIVGKTITLEQEKYTVVGVLAPGNEPPSHYRNDVGGVWTPLGSSYPAQEFSNRGRHNWMVIGRLRPGVSLSQADQEMRLIGANLAREYPATNEKVGAFVAPLREHFVASSRRILIILLATVLLVLLIACSNLANLLLSRSIGRSREFAVRAAVGARVSQMVRQFLCESLLLCGAGCTLGVLLATTTFPFLAHLAPGEMTAFKQLAIDTRVLLFALAVAMLTALVFGLVPLLQLRRVNVSQALKQGSRTLTAVGPRRLRNVLICAEVSLAFLLLIAAGLLIQTVRHLRGVDVGCRTEGVLTMAVPSFLEMSGARGPSNSSLLPAQIASRQRELLRRVAAIPGVRSAGFTNHIPLTIKGNISGVNAEGRDPKDRVQAKYRSASPGFLHAMGIPLLRGRDIEEGDGEGAPPVVVVNRALAQALWPDQDPIGRRLIVANEYQPLVIGEAGNVRLSGLNAPAGPAFYLSSLQGPMRANALAINTSVDPNSIVSAVRAAIWSYDPTQPITDVATMEDVLDKEVFQRRLQTTLLSVFAGLALLLSSIGIYSLLAHLVRQQTPEIGVRIALGATRSNIVARVVGQALRLTAGGICLGIVGALIAARALGAILFGIKATDPATYAAAASVLLLTAVVASYLPARRAMSVDPNVALREE